MQAYAVGHVAMESGDKGAAVKAYQDLLASYKLITTSSLGKPHKDLAYQQVQSLYHDIQSMPSATVLKNASPVKTASTAPVESSYASTQSSAAKDSAPRDSFLSKLSPRDYVTLSFFAVLIVLVLFVKPEFLGFAAGTPNAAPRWYAPTTLTATAGQAFVFDLSTAFRDPDGETLVYLASGSPGLQVTIRGSVVSVLPSAAGNYVLTMMASDLSHTTKVPVALQVS